MFKSSFFEHEKNKIARGVYNGTNTAPTLTEILSSDIYCYTTVCWLVNLVINYADHLHYQFAIEML